MSVAGPEAELSQAYRTEEALLDFLPGSTTRAVTHNFRYIIRTTIKVNDSMGIGRVF